MAYNYPYNHATKTSEILNLRSNCSTTTIMCVGGSNSQSDPLLKVVACGNCLSITTQTILNQPKFYGSAYWYFTENQSFGFSPSSNINQNQADDFDLSSNERLSWHLDQGIGGWRLGSKVSLNADGTSFKKVFINGKYLALYF
jgi:hypothetical protein